MTKEEIQQVLIENEKLKEALAYKQQHNQDPEGLLMSALLRIQDLERRVAKERHPIGLPPSRDHDTRKPMGQRPGS